MRSPNGARAIDWMTLPIVIAALSRCGGGARTESVASPTTVVVGAASSQGVTIDGGEADAAADARVRECNRLINAVNAATSNIEAESESLKGESADDFARMAAAIDDAAEEIGDARLSDETLSASQARYVEVIGRMAKSMRDAGAAIAKHDATAAVRAQNDFKQADTDEDAVRADITMYCSGAASK